MTTLTAHQRHAPIAETAEIVIRKDQTALVDFADDEDIDIAVWRRGQSCSEAAYLQNLFAVTRKNRGRMNDPLSAVNFIHTDVSELETPYIKRESDGDITLRWNGRDRSYRDELNNALAKGDRSAKDSTLRQAFVENHLETCRQLFELFPRVKAFELAAHTHTYETKDKGHCNAPHKDGTPFAVIINYSSPGTCYPSDKARHRDYRAMDPKSAWHTLAGDVSVHRGEVTHGSPANTPHRERLAFALFPVMEVR